MDNKQLFDFIFPVTTWIAVFILVRPKRIVELLPMGMISMLALFGADLYFISMHAHGFTSPILPIFGIPVLWPILGFGGGILLGHFLKPVFTKKVILIAIFSLIARGVDFLEVLYGAHYHNNLQWYHNLVLNFVVLAFAVWVAEGLFYDRIYGKKEP